MSYKGGGERRVPLRNMTFWTGAGFSKSWDLRSPTGAQLFTVPIEELEDVFSLETLARLFGYQDSSEDISFERFQQLVYLLDVQEAFPEIRSRYYDLANIGIIRNKLRNAIAARFETMCPKVHLREDTQKFTMATASTEQADMVRFFRRLWDQSDGSSGLAEGLRYHFISTNYDFIIETILDAFLAPDDSHFLYTYRGVTPARLEGFTIDLSNRDHWLMSHILKLNGGFEIFREQDGYVFDYTAGALERPDGLAPNIIMPSREQVYTDSYFREIFAKAVRLMRDTSVLVIVGYSLPVEDAVLRFIIRQFAEEGEDAVDKHIFYVDMLPETEQRARLTSLFTSIEAHGVPRIHCFSGTFAAFAAACEPLLP
ncbi:SIR2 family protein [Brevundimonas sp.]|uniref:SIR2 family protein n=1 Tax=Brevundimonas sp. TaxID=1871086 RepID=UPI002D6A9B2F|nr:SIR2 family protein [Brevundimonas sp.]HYC68812.1 SIR2 family protein [Brevundimonas sp.]